MRGDVFDKLRILPRIFSLISEWDLAVFIFVAKVQHLLRENVLMVIASPYEDIFVDDANVLVVLKEDCLEMRNCVENAAREIEEMFGGRVRILPLITTPNGEKISEFIENLEKELSWKE
ncbi:MAG: hypothetical protein ACTSXJ_09890 [Candidatus Baldrarchaeia archaeon]